jgi:hypothetical protein
MNKPTPEELDAFVETFNWPGWICSTFAKRNFASAVLDKWGQPAQAPSVLEDAARYRLLRRKVAIAGSRFHILNLVPLGPEQYPDEGLDKAIDAARAAQEGK